MILEDGLIDVFCKYTRYSPIDLKLAFAVVGKSIDLLAVAVEKADTLNWSLAQSAVAVANTKNQKTETPAPRLSLAEEIARNLYPRTHVESVEELTLKIRSVLARRGIADKEE